MPFRRQLTVASPLSGSQIAGAILDTFAHSDSSALVSTELAREFGAAQVLLTDSGTAALVLALRRLAKPGAAVAMPAYACVDLVAAARRAEVRVRLFDVDPRTLSPDMESLRQVIKDGVSAVVVAHLYGFPANMPAVMEIAREAGVPVIEDAAQHACATIGGKSAGSFGDLAVLSFGRGKGTTSGRGGALLAREAVGAAAARGQPLASLLASGDRASTAGDITVAAASWALGRPWLYGIPASLPALHLGETVYHDAGEPLRMSRGAIALLDRTLADMHHAAAGRRANALVLADAADQSRQLTRTRPIDDGVAGYLRFPVLLHSGPRDSAALGIAHGYPRPLPDEPEAQSCVVPPAIPLHGARELAERLVTLPTHHMVTGSDLMRLSAWLRTA